MVHGMKYSWLLESPLEKNYFAFWMLFLLPKVWHTRPLALNQLWNFFYQKVYKKIEDFQTYFHLKPYFQEFNKFWHWKAKEHCIDASNVSKIHLSFVNQPTFRNPCNLFGVKAKPCQMYVSIMMVEEFHSISHELQLIFIFQ